MSTIDIRGIRVVGAVMLLVLVMAAAGGVTHVDQAFADDIPRPTTANFAAPDASLTPEQYPADRWVAPADPELGTRATLPTEGTIELTPNQGRFDGYAYWNHAIATSRLRAQFDITMGSGTGGDGMSFSLADANHPGRTNYTCCGADLGFGGGTGHAVQFDTFQNNGCDSSANLVAVAAFEPTSNSYGCTHLVAADLDPAAIPLTQASAPVTHHVAVDATWGSTPHISVDLDGGRVLDYDDPSLPASVLVGFGGGTGNATDEHAVSNLDITTGVPAPEGTSPCGQSGVFALQASPGTPLPGIVTQQPATFSTGPTAVAYVAAPTTDRFSELQATIDWGDGSPPTIGTILPAGGLPCEVDGEHAYASPGHYLITADVSDGTRSARVYDVASIYPALDPDPPAAVGVLVGDADKHPPQCTATVVDPDASTAQTPAGRRLLDTIRRVGDRHVRELEHDVVVTARHCIPVAQSGEVAQPWMFAPAFTGVSPLFLQDFARHEVSTESSANFGGSPFHGKPIGTARLGVWGSTLPPIFARGSDADDDWAFLVMNVRPRQASSTLAQQVGGGVPIHFEGERASWSATSPRRWTFWGHDVSWTDAPITAPADLPGAELSALTAQGGKLDDEGAGPGACPDGPGSSHPICGIDYPWVARANGLHRCAATTSWPPGAVPADALTGPDADAFHVSIGACHLGNFSSGGPYVTDGALWAVNKGPFNAGRGSCCTNVGTFISSRALSVLADYAALAPVLSRFGLLARVFAVAGNRARHARASGLEVASSAAAAGAVRRGTTIRYTLSQASMTRLRFQRATRGQRFGRRCRATTRANRARRACTRFVAVGTLRRSGRPGVNRVFFDGRLGARRLRAGRYRLVASAANAFGRTGHARTLSFRVVSR